VCVIFFQSELGFVACIFYAPTSYHHLSTFFPYKIMTKFNFAAACLLLACGIFDSTPIVVSAVGWEVLDNVKIPTALSDNTATYVPSAGTILLAGGCNAKNGNTFIDAEGEELDFFYCGSISDKLYGFNPEDETFATLADLPRQRYRHAAVLAAGRLWLLGGRNVEDEVIAEIDVYDPETNTWSTPGIISEEYLTSDNGAFTNADESQIYVVGGYNPFYTAPEALSVTLAIDVASALDTDEPVIFVEEKASLNTQRGDVHAVSSPDGKKAYVAGGFESYPCVPLTSVEVYDIESDTWSYTDDLNSARGDKALVQLDGKIYAIGGETSHPDQCAEDPLDVPPLSAQSVAVDDVEVFHPNKNKWTVLSDIPNFRFRFSGAAHPDTGVIYTFGGQDAFDADCKCFPTNDNVVAYTVAPSSPASMIRSRGGISGGTAMVAAVIAAVVGMM